MRVAVAGESIYDSCGLGYFLASGVRWLAKLNPTWEFHVVVRMRFNLKYGDLLGASNIILHVWDETPTLKWLQQNIKVRGCEYAIRFAKKYIPITSWRAKMGDLCAIWKSLPTFDVIWVPHFDIGSRQWPILYTDEFTKIPILFTIHDIHPVFYPNDWSSHALSNFYKGFVPFAKRCSRIITHSNFQKLAITDHLGIYPDKIMLTCEPPLMEQITLVGNDHVEEDMVLLRSRYSIVGPYFLYPGSTGFTHKNHIRLLLAWHKLKSIMRQDCPVLVCTAQGQHWPVLKTLIEALELQKYVIFTDIVLLEHLAALYRRCTFVIVPTLYEGGGSGPVAEGILSGKPVISSAIPPIKEQLHAYGITGVSFFDPTDISTIVDTVKIAWNNRTKLEEQAEKDQKRLAMISSSLWEKWAAVYSREITQLSVC